MRAFKEFIFFNVNVIHIQKSRRAIVSKRIFQDSYLILRLKTELKFLIGYYSKKKAKKAQKVY